MLRGQSNHRQPYLMNTTSAAASGVSVDGEKNEGAVMERKKSESGTAARYYRFYCHQVLAGQVKAHLSWMIACKTKRAEKDFS